MYTDEKIRRLAKHLSRYSQMLIRCYDKDCKAYNSYGGKGIVVCDEWLNSFDSFVEWCESNGYEEGLVLDKDILCDEMGISPKVYSPLTCKFITVEDNRAYMLENTARQAVASYNKQGVLVKSYKSISECVDEYGNSVPNIGRACRGLRKTVNGLYWRYINSLEEAPLSILIPKKEFLGKPIVETDINGTVIAEYPNAVEAAKATGLSKSSICAVANGSRSSLFGRFFKKA